jgi:adenylate cyclase
VSVQKELQARNAELPEQRRMEFRIGINLGDVIEEEERIYGDGVNIAARLESLADPGGICVSKTAFDQIETKLPLGYEYLGEQEVKNIAKPVGAYRVLMEPRVTVAEEIEKKKAVPVWRRKAILAEGIVAVLVVIALLIWNHYLRRPPVEPASVDRMAFPLPEKPSIAVLPFVNMSEDHKQEYFSDGLTEEIITALSKVPKLFVIARNSTFAYKGKYAKVQQVAEELGVRYVLEGSVRKSEDKVRVTAQLIDAVKGHHLWAEKYDRDLKDIFALQDEITKQILTAIELKLTEGEHARLWIKKPKSLEAYLKYLQAREYSLRYNKDDNILARQLGEEAIVLDPEYAAAYRVVAGTHLYDARFGWSDSPARSMERVIELVQKALSIDDSLPAAHCLLGAVYLMKRDFEKALAEAELEIALKPNSPGVFVGLGAILACVGRTEEAVQWVEKAIRLNPLPPPNYLTIQG